MTHEEFDRLCSTHFTSQIKETSEDGLVMAYRHDDKIQLIIEHMPVHGLMQMLSQLAYVIENPLLVVAAVKEGLERGEGVSLECLAIGGNQETGDKLVQMLEAKLSSNEEVEWPDGLDILGATSES